MSFTVQFSIVIPRTGKKKANIRRCASKCLKINVNYFSSTISNLRAWVDRLCHLLGCPTPRIIYERGWETGAGHRTECCLFLEQLRILSAKPLSGT